MVLSLNSSKRPDKERPLENFLALTPEGLEGLYSKLLSAQKTAALPPKLSPAMGNVNGRETKKAARNAAIMVASWRNESVMNPRGRTFLSHHNSSGHQMDSDIQHEEVWGLKRTCVSTP